MFKQQAQLYFEAAWDSSTVTLNDLIQEQSIQIWRPERSPLRYAFTTASNLTFYHSISVTTYEEVQAHATRRLPIYLLRLLIRINNACHD